MPDYMKQAEGLRDELNDKLGRRFHPVTKMDDVLDQARRICKKAEAYHIVTHTVYFDAVLRGKEVMGTAEVLFAGFETDENMIWVAMPFYQDGAVNAVIPFTFDTNNMQWLEYFVKQELEG